MGLCIPSPREAATLCRRFSHVTPEQTDNSERQHTTEPLWMTGVLYGWPRASVAWRPCRAYPLAWAGALSGVHLSTSAAMRQMLLLWQLAVAGKRYLPVELPTRASEHTFNYCKHAIYARVEHCRYVAHRLRLMSPPSRHALTAAATPREPGRLSAPCATICDHLRPSDGQSATGPLRKG